MSNVRNWASGIVIAALILFGPIIAFVTLITVEGVDRLGNEGGRDRSLARRRRRYGVGFVTQVRGAASYISIEVGRSLTGAASAAEASSATRHACSLRGAAWAGGQAKPLLNSRSLVTSSVSFSIINFCLDEKLVPPVALLVTEGQGLIAPFFGWRVHARMRIATPNLTRFNHIFSQKTVAGGVKKPSFGVGRARSSRCSGRAAQARPPY
jgi:hypothetical protein